MKRVNKWKRILAVLLTVVMLVPSNLTLIGAAAAEPDTEPEVIMPLSEEGGTGDAGDGNVQSGDNTDQGESGGQGGTSGGTDSDGSQPSGGDEGQGGGQDSGSGGEQVGNGGQDGSGNGSDGGNENGAGGSDDGSGNDGNGSGSGNDSEDDGEKGNGVGDGSGENGNDSTDGDSNQNDNTDGSDGQDGTDANGIGMGSLSIGGSEFIQEIRYEYTKVEGANPWENKFSMPTVDENQKPVYNEAYKTVVKSEFYQIMCSESEENPPQMTAELNDGISLSEGQELYYYNGEQFQQISPQPELVLQIPSGKVFGFVLTQENRFTKTFGEAEGSEVCGQVRVTACEANSEQTTLKIEELGSDNEYISQMDADLENVTYKLWKLSLVKADGSEAELTGNLTVNLTFNPSLWGERTGRVLYYLSESGLTEAKGDSDSLSFEAANLAVFGIAVGDEYQAFDSGVINLDGQYIQITAGAGARIPQGTVATVVEGQDDYNTILSGKVPFANPVYKGYKVTLTKDESTVIPKEAVTVTVTGEETTPLLQLESEIKGSGIWLISEDEKVLEIGAPTFGKTEDGMAVMSSSFVSRLMGTFVLAVAPAQEKTYNLSKGAPYTGWISQDDSGLYYKNKGEWEKYLPGSGHEFATGNPIKVQIAYNVPKEITIYPGDKICYQLNMGDSGSVMYGQDNVPIILDGTDRIIGHFTISKSGMITVEYSSDWLTNDGEIPGRNNISTVLEASGELNFTDSGDEDHKKYIYIGDIKLEFKVKDKAKKTAVHVEKTVDYKNSDRQVTDAEGNVYQQYKLVVTAQKDNTEPITTFKVHDYFDATRNGGYATYLNEEGKKIQVSEKPGRLQVDLSEPVIDNDKKTMDFNVTIRNPENPEDGFGGNKTEEVISITYWVKIDKSIWYKDIKGNETRNLIRNTAEVSGEDFSGRLSDWEEVKFSKDWFSKNGDISVQSGEDAKVSYTVHINKSPVVDIKGWTVRDTLQTTSTIHHYDKESIKVIKHEGGKSSFVDNFTVDVDGDGREYIEFIADGPYYYELKYDTEVTLGGESTLSKLENKIELIPPAGSGIGTGPSTTTTVSYDIFPIAKKVFGQPDYIHKQIKWKTTLSAYRNGNYLGNIPVGAIYTDELSCADSAKSHTFDWDKVNLTLTDGEGRELTPEEDYTFVKKDETSYSIRFQKDAVQPVEIVYISQAGFGMGGGAKETYDNKGTLIINNDVKHASASVEYKVEDIIEKKVKTPYNAETRTITWQLLVNNKKIKFPADCDLKIIDKLPQGLKVKSVKYDNGTDIGGTWSTDENGNLVIDYQGHVDELSGRARWINIVTSVEGIGSLIDENGNITFTNTAEIYIGNELIEKADASEGVHFDKLKKEAYYDSSSTNRVVRYTVSVNEAGLPLGNGAEKLIFKDKMGENMSLVPNSIEVKNQVTGTDITSSCKLIIDTESNEFTLELPNSTPVKVSYRVSFNSNTDKVSLQNTATLLGTNGQIEEVKKENEFKVNQAQGSTSAGGDIILYKVDGEDAKVGLAGAEFALYKLKDGVSPDKATDGDWEKQQRTVRSDKDGKIAISNVEINRFYYIIETKAPEGYVCDTQTKYKFVYVRTKAGQELVVPKDFTAISQNSSGFYIRNDKARLAIDKVFTDENGKTLGSYPNGTYYFAVYQGDEIAKTIDNKAAVGSINVHDGKITNLNAGKYPLIFYMEKSDKEYTVYETDERGNILKAADGKDYIETNKLRFAVNREDCIGTDVIVDENSNPAVAIIENRLISQPRQMQLKVKKNLEGRDLEAEEFSFTMEEKNTHKVVASAVNDSEGDVVFSPVTYTLKDAGVYEYVIKEKKGSLPDMTYSEQEFYVNVEVEAKDGVVTIKQVKVGEKLVTPDSAGIYDATNNAVFINTYTEPQIPAISLDVKGKKELKNHNLNAGDFSFKLTGIDGAPIKISGEKGYQPVNELKTANVADGGFQFDSMYYEADDLGDETSRTYRYVITEVLPNGVDKYNPVREGITYDTMERILEVTLSKKNKTELQITTKLDDVSYTPENAEELLKFQNTYFAEGEFSPVLTKRVIPVTRTQELENQSFKFNIKYAKLPQSENFPEKAEDLSTLSWGTVYRADGTEISEVSNEKDGRIVFGEIRYQEGTTDSGEVHDIGKYVYKIEEKNTNLEGYTYADPVYIFVTVTDNGNGKLDVNSEYKNSTLEPGQGTFINTYKSEGELTLGGWKSLDGSKLNEGQFTFTLEMATADADGNPGEFSPVQINGVDVTANNKEDGTFAFPTIRFEENPGPGVLGKGNYFFRIKELIPDVKATGYSYSDKEYIIKAVVKDAPAGSKTLKVEVAIDGEEYNAQQIVFKNSYTAAGTYKIDGEKVLEGSKLTDGQFTFELSKVNGTERDVLQRVKNNGSHIGFEAIEYTQSDAGKEFTYEVREVLPEDEERLDGVTYTESVYTIKVLVVDKGNGELLITRPGYTADNPETPLIMTAGQETDKIVFTNKFAGSASLLKTTGDGKTPLAGAVFELYKESAESGEYELYQTCTSGDEGQVYVDGLGAGNYYFIETKAPAGYLISTDEQGKPVRYAFTIGIDSGVGEVENAVVHYSATIINYSVPPVVEDKVDVSVQKLDEQGNALAGATLAIYDGDTKQIVDTWVSDGTYHIVRDLTPGKAYYLSELKAPEGYLIAEDVAFTAPTKGSFTVTMTDKKDDGRKNSIRVTKKLSMVDENLNIVDAYAADYTTYVGIFTDAEGKQPYGSDYIRTVNIRNATSSTVTFTDLPDGTYYIFETDAKGNPIPFGELQKKDNLEFICQVEGSSNSVKIGEGNYEGGDVVLNNTFYNLPEHPDNPDDPDIPPVQFDYRAFIYINKQVVKNGSSTAVDDVFYAGVFTTGEDGNYELMDGMLYELVQNGTITVEVPLGGEKGDEPITYYIMETDAQGNPVSSDESFAYQVSGEGEVTVDKDNQEVSLTITNEVTEESTELSFQKVDENGNGLAGAEFELRTKKGSVLVEKWISGTSVRVLNLMPGMYVLTETKAPDGYKKGADVVLVISENGDVTVDGQSVDYDGDTIRYENKKQPGKVDTVTSGGNEGTKSVSKTVDKTAVKTADDTNILLYLYLIVLAAGVIIVSLYKVHRKEN